jgi:hypothetical protein
MKTQLKSIALVFTALSITVFSCRNKEVIEDPLPAQTANETAQVNNASDDNDTQSELEEIGKDVDNVSAGSFANARMDATERFKPLGVRRIDSIVVDGKTRMSIYYDSASFFRGRKRTGSVTFTLTKGTAWREKGAEITIITNLMVEKRNGKMIKISGTHVNTNVTGGTLYRLLFDKTDTIIHESRATDIKIEFIEKDGTSSGTRTRNIAKRRTAYFSNNQLTVSVQGLETKNGYTNVDAWGTNRKGEDFTSVISSPLIFTTCTDFWTPISGTKEHYSSNSKLTTVFGTDKNGTQINSCSADGMFLTWEYNNKTRTKFVEY